MADKDALDALENIKSIFEDFKKTNNQAIDDLKKNRGVADLEAKMGRMEKDLEKQEKIIKSVEELEVQMKRRGTGVEDKKSEAKAVFEEFLSKGLKKMTPDQLKLLSVQSDPDGGFNVLPDTGGRTTGKIFETSPMRRIANVQSINTDALEGKIQDDAPEARFRGETQPVTDTANATLGVWRIPAMELYAIPTATAKLLEDANFNVSQWHANLVSEEFMRKENSSFVLGDGIIQPRGFLTFPASADANIYERGKIGQVITENSLTITFDDLIEINYKLKEQWRMRGTYMMNRSTFAVVRKLKDQEGQYLWQPSTQIGQPSTILGAPTIEFNDMPDVGTDTLALAFGDMNDTYQIVDRLGISVLRDDVTDWPNVQFKTRKRVGGDVVGFDSLKILKIKA